MFIDKCIGNTPVIRFEDSALIPNNKRLYLKLEMFNVTFSVKARTALGLIQKAEASGKLLKGGTIIESTSGNLGKAIAAIGASKKYKVILIVDPKIEKSVLNEYKALGAEIVMVTETDELGGYQKSRIKKAKELECNIRHSVWLNQYNNLDNSTYHYEYTTDEIVNDINTYKIKAIVSAVSTGGHLSGIGHGVKEYDNRIQIIASDVKGSTIFGGNFQPYLINGPGLSFKANNLLHNYIDKYAIVSDEEAISLIHYISSKHGLLLGGSSGLSIFTAINVLLNTDVNSVLVICPDSGVNYLNSLYDNDWLYKKGIKCLDQTSLLERMKRKRLEKLI